MTAPTSRPASFSATPDRRRAVVVAGTSILAGAVLLLAQQFVLSAPGPVPSLIGMASHVAVGAGLLALAHLRAAGPGRASRIGLVLWALSSLPQIVTSVDVRVEEAGAVVWPWQVVGAAWLLTMTVGALLGGVGIVRAGVLTGGRRWLPLAFGISQILVFLPPVLGIYALLSVVPLTGFALQILLGAGLLTAFRGAGVTGEWARSGAVLDAP